MKEYLKIIFSEKDHINAPWALFAFAIYTIGLAIGGLIALLIILGVASVDQSSTFFIDVNTWEQYNKYYEYPIVLIQNIVAFALLLLLILRIFRNSLTDRSSIGVALVMGKPIGIFIGIFLGVIMASLYIYMSNNLFSQVSVWQLVVESDSRVYAGVVLVSSILNTTILVPVVEEVLFRGILLAGFNRSLGVLWGCVSTTIFFILWHGSNLENLHYLLLLFCLAIALLIIRFKTRAIGPAIALHSSFNMAIYFFK